MSCPLCTDDTEVLLNGEWSIKSKPTYVSKSKLKYHIGSHLERLALFALPPSYRSADEEDISSNAGIKASSRSSLSSTYSLPTVTDTESLTRLVTGWYQNCVKSHPLCGNLLDINTITKPRRLLGLADLDHVRVITTQDLTSPVYAFFSWVWGHGDCVKLTKSTEVGLQTGFKHDILLQTHKDAIYTTKALELRYLWIDALCILQDNPMD